MNAKGYPIQIQQIVQIGSSAGVTLSNELLEHLNLVVGENVQIEMKEHELIVRKLIPHEFTEIEDISRHDYLQETRERYAVQFERK